MPARRGVRHTGRVLRRLAMRDSRWLGHAVFGVVLALVPAVFTRVGFYTMSTAVEIGVFAIATEGLVLLSGFAGQISIGQAAFYAIGAYASALLTTRVGLAPPLAALAGVCGAVLVALVIGRPVFRARGHYLALSTLAFGLVVYYLVKQLGVTGGASGVADIPHLQLGGIVLDSDLRMYVLVAVALWLAVVIADNLVRSPFGRTLRAIGDSEAAARACGVDIARQKLMVFAVSAGLAAVAGSLYAHWVTFVDPNVADLLISLQFLIMAVVGGLRSVWGAPLGAFVVVTLTQLAREWLPSVAPHSGGSFEIVVYGAALIAVLLFLPAGLAGALTRRVVAPPSPVAPPPKSSSAPVPAAPDTKIDGATITLRGVTRRFGGVRALDGVDVDVAPGRIVGVIGPNGAGKTTLFNVLCGVTPPSSGTVLLDGRDLAGMAPDRVARLGVARTFQNLEVFGSLTVLDNVVVPRRVADGVWSALLRLPGARAADRVEQARARQILARLGLADLAEMAAGDLSAGQQRRVEVARALSAAPRLLLLDEPMAGLTARERRELAEVARSLAAAGTTVVIVEHDVDAVMNLCDHVVVLDGGKVIASGPPQRVRGDPAVITAYLGAALEDS